jgi:hypothetical protein
MAHSLRTINEDEFDFRSFVRSIMDNDPKEAAAIVNSLIQWYSPH